MKRKEKLRKLTWKYFWEQKKNEISEILLILFVAYSIVGLIFQFGWVSDCWASSSGWEVDCSNIPYEPFWPIWMMISGLVTTGIWVLVGLRFWVISNWNKATKRAKEDLE